MLIWMVGSMGDICQEVCPWNDKFEHVSDLIDFQPRKEILNFENDDWDNLSVDDYTSIFKNSPVKRTKYNGLKRNINHNKRKATLWERIGVLLSGCGAKDGSEIHESAITLLALDKAGVKISILTPNTNQHHVVDHLNKMNYTKVEIFY